MNDNTIRTDTPPIPKGVFEGIHIGDAVDIIVTPDERLYGHVIGLHVALTKSRRPSASADVLVHPSSTEQYVEREVAIEVLDLQARNAMGLAEYPGPTS